MRTVLQGLLLGIVGLVWASPWAVAETQEELRARYLEMQRRKALSPDAIQRPGMFGERTLGGSFERKQGTLFRGGIKTGADGSFQPGPRLGNSTLFSRTGPTAESVRSAIPEEPNFRQPIGTEQVGYDPSAGLPSQSAFPVPRTATPEEDPTGPEPYYLGPVEQQSPQGSEGPGGPDVWFRSRPQSDTPGMPSIGAATRVPGGEPAGTSSAPSGSLSQRLSSNPSVQSLSPLTVTVSKGTATLRGSVATPLDARIAERLLLLEPNIRKVDNQLTIGNSAPPVQIPNN